MKPCTICKGPLPEGQSVNLYSANYCSDQCKREAGRRYDAYVDPMGWYTAKAEAGDPYD